MTYNSLRLVHVWLDEYKVQETSLIWKDESTEWACSKGAFYCISGDRFRPPPVFLKLATPRPLLVPHLQTVFSISSF